MTCDLWQDFGTFTLTGIAPTAIGGDALFDRIELLEVAAGKVVAALAVVNFPSPLHMPAAWGRSFKGHFSRREGLHC